MDRISGSPVGFYQLHKGQHMGGGEMYALKEILRVKPSDHKLGLTGLAKCDPRAWPACAPNLYI